MEELIMGRALSIGIERASARAAPAKPSILRSNNMLISYDGTNLLENERQLLPLCTL
jgi:hypothetical protein